MKICMIFEIKEAPSGGGYQFARALRQYLITEGVYTTNPAEADICLFNSYQTIDKVLKAKYSYPDKIFVHRMDGPIQLFSREKDLRDRIVFTANRVIADATIFQSLWSRERNYELGLQHKPVEIVIFNAPDPEIFNKKDKVVFSPKRRIRLIANSWSPHWKKGFAVYQWLDKNLDFVKYEMVFVGNSPIKFSNIVHLPPMDSAGLARELKNSDIYITASQKDPCSNSLIEALHCGLPAIALRDGGHPELVGSGGELFTKEEEIPGLIARIAADYDRYLTAIVAQDISESGRQYVDFFKSVLQYRRGSSTPVRRVTIYRVLTVFTEIILWKLFVIIAKIINKYILRK